VKEHLFANSPKEAEEFERAIRDAERDPIKDVDREEEDKVEL
jgi:hypothetical protein